MQTISPLSATIGPVREFAKAIGATTQQTFYVVNIPETSKCFDMGFRFASVPGDMLQDYLDHGATLAN